MKTLQFYFTSVLEPTLESFGGTIDQKFLLKDIQKEFGYSYMKPVWSSPTETAAKLKQCIENPSSAKDSIAGIIVPLCNSDPYILSETVELASGTNYHNNNESLNNFFRTMRIPVFEAHLTLPGYAGNKRAIGDFTPETYLPLVRSAYGIWLEKNRHLWIEQIEKNIRSDKNEG